MGMSVRWRCSVAKHATVTLTIFILKLKAESSTFRVPLDHYGICTHTHNFSSIMVKIICCSKQIKQGKDA